MNILATAAAIVLVIVSGYMGLLALALQGDSTLTAALVVSGLCTAGKACDFWRTRR